MNTRRILWPAVIAVIAITLTFSWLAARRVPSGQPPLVTLDTASLETLRSEFNRAADQTRVIVLLSPT